MLKNIRYGLWCMVYDIWFMADVYGIWFMVYSTWKMVYMYMTQCALHVVSTNSQSISLSTNQFIELLRYQCFMPCISRYSKCKQSNQSLFIKFIYLLKYRHLHIIT